MLKYYYTFDEIIELENTPLSLDGDKLVGLLMNLQFNDNLTAFNDLLALHNLTTGELLSKKLVDNVEKVNSTPYTKLFSLLKLRYASDYLPAVDEEIVTINKAIKPLNHWAKSFMAILFYTKDKYATILNIYQDNLNKLMDKLKTIHLGSGNTSRHEDYDTDMTGKNLMNDTPQTTDVVATIEGNQYASELSKSEAHTDNVGDVSEARQESSTTEADSMTTMAKIKEIQDSYEQVLRKWSDEFSPIFKEEA